MRRTASFRILPLTPCRASCEPRAPSYELPDTAYCILLPKVSRASVGANGPRRRRTEGGQSVCAFHTPSLSAFPLLVLCPPASKSHICCYMPCLRSTETSLRSYGSWGGIWTWVVCGGGVGFCLGGSRVVAAGCGGYVDVWWGGGVVEW